MAFDIGWAPDPNMLWGSVNQAVLFALETQAGPGIDTHLIANTNVGAWVAAAHANNVQAFISIGGSDNQNWPTACNNTNRAQFVSNLVGFARSHGFDGIDLDIEDAAFFSQGPPNPAMTACVDAAASAAHTAGLSVAADVITNWTGGWWAPSRNNIDQFNLMTYCDSLGQLQADVQSTINQGLPASKFVVGIDTIDCQPPSDCGAYASWAASNGLAGAFVWATTSDPNYRTRARTCLGQLGLP